MNSFDVYVIIRRGVLQETSFNRLESAVERAQQIVELGGGHAEVWKKVVDVNASSEVVR
jgi:hypothetical protein